MSEQQLPTFTPSEVHKLLGISPAQQRDWRRHNFLPSTEEGWTRYSVAELCRIFLFKAFASQNIGPTDAKSAVDDLVGELAERVEDIVTDGHERRPAEGVAVRWADGTLETFPSIDIAFSEATADKQVQEGPQVVFMLHTLATAFGIKVRDFIQARG